MLAFPFKNLSQTPPSFREQPKLSFLLFVPFQGKLDEAFLLQVRATEIRGGPRALQVVFVLFNRALVLEQQVRVVINPRYCCGDLPVHVKCPVSRCAPSLIPGKFLWAPQ